MRGLAYACAVALAAVFVRAGAAKLARPATASAGFAALGLPLAGPAARAVPVAELVVAALLLGRPRAGGVAAMALLGLFSAVVARAVLGGSTAPCNCFGAASPGPVSVVDLARNLGLAGLAVAAALAAEPVLPAPGAVVAVAAVLAAGTAALAAARRAQDR